MIILQRHIGGLPLKSVTSSYFIQLLLPAGRSFDRPVLFWATARPIAGYRSPFTLTSFHIIS